MRIANNIMAMNAHRQLAVNQANVQKSIEKLSSGLRINRAGDDAAGLAISEKMRGQIRGLNQAARNAQDGISLIQTAEGAMNEIHSILQRMRELAVQASNDTYTKEDRIEIQKEINQLLDEIDGIADRTQFNTQHLTNVASGATFTFQVGANEGQTIDLTIASMKTDQLGDGTNNLQDELKVDLSDPATASGGVIDDAATAAAAITLIDEAINQVSSERSALGAVQNRLEHTIANLNNAAENLQAAESRIRDVDMAAEMMNFTKNQILQQASTAMLAQANMAPQSVLQLLG